MAKPTDDDKAGEVLKGFLDAKRYREGIGWDATAIKAQNFYFGNQYEEDIRAALSNANRADSTFNHVLPAIELLCGHQLEMQTDLVVKPHDRLSDPYVARFISSAIKQVEQSNDVDFEDPAQFLDGLITGVGVKDKLYDTEEYIEGKIVVRQDSSMDYYLDINFRRYDYTDANVLYRMRWLTMDQAKDIYGDNIEDVLGEIETSSIAWFQEFQVQHGYDQETDYGNRGGYLTPTDMGSAYPDSGYDSKTKRYRFVEEFKRVTEQYKVYWDEETREWRDTGELDEEQTELLKDTFMERKRHRILQSTLAGHELVVDEEDIGCREFYHRFSLFFPYFTNGRFMGAVESLFSPQEEINKHHSSLMHILSTLGANKVLYTDAFLPPDSETDINVDWPKTGQAMPVAALKDKDGNDTYRIVEAPQIPAVYERDGLKQEQTIRDISGASLQMSGKGVRRESGRAKQTEIERGAVRLAPMIKRFRMTRKLDGRSYIYYMQKYYGEERYVRVYGERMGESDQEIVLNKRALGTIVNDITIGEYDIWIEFEGKTPSERDSTYWRLIELANTVPEYRDIIGEIVLSVSDMPEKDQVLEKVRERQQQVQAQGGQAGGPPGQDGTRRMPNQLLQNP